ncbi:oxidoreductase, partial [bacterium]|nr:oxidoreductase [bacterium]
MNRNKSMVVGSTGLIGSSLVHQLIEGGEPVKALTRGDQLTSNSILEYIKVDFDALELNSESFSDIKDIYICLG